MIKIKGKDKGYGIEFPTSIEELTPAILAGIVESIKLPKHYCIITLAFKTKVFDFVASINNKRDASIGVVPLLAKISTEDSAEVNAIVGDRIIIDRSSLERGVYVNPKCSISSNAARNYFSSCPDLVKRVLGASKEKEDVELRNANIIILEFKIVPVTDIAAAIPMTINSNDIFIYHVEDTDKEQG